MSVLYSIIEGVREDLAIRRKSMAQILEALDQAAPVRDPLASLIDSQMSVIAEVKRASPSKGALSPINDPAALAELFQHGDDQDAAGHQQARHRQQQPAQPARFVAVADPVAAQAEQGQAEGQEHVDAVQDHQQADPAAAGG